MSEKRLLGKSQGKYKSLPSNLTRNQEKISEKSPVSGVLESVISSLKTEMGLAQTFLRKCTKPSRKEYIQLLKAHAIGILFLGFLGYTITFVHIPINNILVGVKR